MTKKRKADKNNLDGMRIMTINVPERYIALFDILVDLGMVKSRSEGMRTMMTEWFTAKIKVMDDLDTFIKGGRQRVLEFNEAITDKERAVNLSKIYNEIKNKRKIPPKMMKTYNLTYEEIVEGIRVREWERGDDILVPEE